jgi:hypothetical protein
MSRPCWLQTGLSGQRERAQANPSLLTGMVFDETGERLTPTYAVKKGTRYRYYVSTSLITGAGRNRSSGRRRAYERWKREGRMNNPRNGSWLV